MKNNNNFIYFIFTLFLIVSFYHKVNCIVDPTATTNEEEDNEIAYFDDGTEEFQFISETELPIKLNGLKAKDIFANAYHSGIINENDEFYHWGLYSNLVTEAPNKIKINNDKKISTVSLGGNFIILQTKDDNQLYSIGKSKYGVLGTGSSIDDDDDNNDNDNEKVYKIEKFNDNIISIVSGYEHSLVVTKDDGIYGWGRNHKNQLGGRERVKDRSSSPSPSEDEYYSKPIKVLKETDPIFKDFKKICSGSDHNLLLGNDGSLYSWGNGYFGALGHGVGSNDKENIYTPKKITTFTLNSNESRIVDIACGGYHSMFLTNDNEIYTFGYGEFGQLGHGENDTSNHYIPKRIKSTGDNAAGNKIKSIFAGDHANSFYITTDGSVYSWGWNDGGSLGHGTNENHYSPKKIQSLSNIKKITSGFKHTLAQSINNDIYVFGDNTFGQTALKFNYNNNNDNNNNNNNNNNNDNNNNLNLGTNNDLFEQKDFHKILNLK
ncbi:hypothetical protein ACTFIW_006099 [Dictyostelium discoideum]